MDKKKWPRLREREREASEREREKLTKRKSEAKFYTVTISRCWFTCRSVCYLVAEGFFFTSSRFSTDIYKDWLEKEETNSSEGKFVFLCLCFFSSLFLILPQDHLPVRFVELSPFLSSLALTITKHYF